MSLIKQKLQQDLQLLEKQLFWVELSVNQCVALGVKADYSIEEFGAFESLCSRYSRGIDFLIRKIFRTIDEYEFENQGTLVDVVNNAHKRGLFDDIEEVRLMKDVRNTIVHEYIEENLQNTFEEVLVLSQALIKIMKTTQDYIKSKLEE